MIDIDDVGDGFLYGGLFVGVVFLVIYLAFSRPEIKECEKNGGVMVKANGDSICIDKKALVATEKKGTQP